MADFNKIFTESPLSVKAMPCATLGFNDGLAFSKTKYALENHMLTLDVNTKDNVSIFYNNGIAATYEFFVKLHKANVELPIYDLNDKEFTNLANKYILVFVNGELQPEAAYTVSDNTLSFNYAYTNDINRFFNVIVYVSSGYFSRTIYSPSEIANINLDNIPLSLTYTPKNTAIFINGEKVSFLAIEKIPPAKNQSNAIKLNIPAVNIQSFEIIKFEDTNTDSINFVTESGYLTYGPYDDYSKKIPSLYDTIITFSDQAKIVVDNLRAGFLVKETKAYGELIIVDDNFESPEVKCITLQKFTYSNYTKNNYYLEVPRYTNITKYLAEFDNKYTFLPEILLIIQRLLLDEVNDSIQRLRDMRSIQKVDSVNIDNLLKLLGFNANIKTLNVKQRRELLEELNEFYRVVGTRYSYNLVNILQNNLKLINMEQLFTPYGLQDKTKKTVYNYRTSLSNGGQNYSVGDYLKTSDGYLSILVDEVDPTTNAITSYTQQNSEGYVPLAGEFPLVGGIEGYFNITSPNNQYRYEWEINSSQNCVPGQKLAASGYNLTITEVDSEGHITPTGFIPSTAAEGNVAITDINHTTFYLSAFNLVGRIASNDVYTNPSDYYLFERFDSGIGETITLDPGKYYIKMSGGGGAGAASTSTSTTTGKTNGSAGEYRVYEFTLAETTTITYYVGQGGGGVYASGSTVDARQLGNGYQQGEMGQNTTTVGNASSGGGVVVNPARTASSGRPYRPAVTASSAYIGGQGGGSSAIVIPNMDPFIAKGGNGGNASNTVSGGIGGNEGTTTGSGSAGSEAVTNGWSADGSHGYIEIYRIKQNYTVTVEGDTTNIPDNQVFSLTTSYITFFITAHRDGDTVTFELLETQVQGYPVINTNNIDMLVAGDTRAVVTIHSIPSSYIYQVQLESDHTLVKPGMTFTGVASDSTHFTYIVSRVDNETGIISGTVTPTHGANPINESYIPAIYQTGTGAELLINSEENTQKNVDRCYIDFYTREELVDPAKGEGFVSYYKQDTLDYRTITEGTPNSPQFWVSGNPDINYGEIANTLEITEATYDYGYITDSVSGEWIEYWNWERGSNWYPTNHVDLEMKIPVGVDIALFVNTFIEQFYNIASTVIFIHSIIESFYFGNENDTNSSTGSIDGIPVKTLADAKPTFGIATGAPVSAEEIIVTSNPHIQYTQGHPEECTLNIVATPSSAEIYIASVHGLILDQGVGSLSYTNNYGTEIIWAVRMPSGYINRAQRRKLTKDTTKYVILERTTTS